MNILYKNMLVQGVSVAQLAKKLGISTQAIYQWKLGRSKPNPMLLKKISKILGINIEGLIKAFY